MSEIANSEGCSESEKPVDTEGVKFPPFPDPKDEDFDDDIGDEERTYYKTVFKDLNAIKAMRIHCSACDRHMGCSARNEVRMRVHPMLRTLVCHNCHIFYNSGEFEKGDDGSELYCRWCGQGGQVYCCSDCPHVFCAKCIRRNLGAPKIKEIENADDWKCFKCNSKCLWDLRALCWAVLRFCDLKNKLVYQTQDQQLKEAYKKDCSIDYSDCCKNKTSKRIQKIENVKKKDIKKEVDVKPPADVKLPANNVISKIPSTIQVKKFAAVNIEDTIKQEKKPSKRSSSPKNKAIFVKNPINIAPCTNVISPISVPPLAKKMRLQNSTVLTNPVRLINERKPTSTYARIRPKPQLPMAIANCGFNGFGTGFNSNLFNTVGTDNINLSLENLTQGLDMAAVAAVAHNTQDDDVVCTPDFPLEPLCEVTEDFDDDVQCITPGPVAPPKFTNPPPLVARSTSSSTASTELSSDNIVQMTDNDVTVNATTGGLKFRVDPQTLSSNKMYRLPDGRIFAINANPTMPGGYSATIVAVTEPTGKSVSKGAIYAAKLNAIPSSTPASTPVPTPKTNRNIPRILKRSTPKTTKAVKSTDTLAGRDCDLNVPVEWYRYNLIDAVDALEYSLSRLHKLKKEATTCYLRTRTVDEMRNLHRTLERLLNTSASRFGEIRENLNKGLKQYVMRKTGGDNSEDDDDVEILPDMEDNDDPIYIDENSVESIINDSENQEVDLTGAGSSDYNYSGDNINKSIISKNEMDPLNISENDNDTNEPSDVLAVISHNTTFEDTTVNNIIIQDCDNKNKSDSDNIQDNDTESKEKGTDPKINNNENENSVKRRDDNGNGNESRDEIVSQVEDNNDMNIDTDVNEAKSQKVKDNPCNDLKCNESVDELNGILGETLQGPVKIEKVEDSMNHRDSNDKADSQDSEGKLQDTEMSDEMIDTLLKDDNVEDEPVTNLKSTDISEVLQDT